MYINTITVSYTHLDVYKRQGLNCVNMAAQMIEAGDADIVVAGGMENRDMAPFALQKARYGYRMGAPMGKSEIVDTMVNDAPVSYTHLDVYKRQGKPRAAGKDGARDRCPQHRPAVSGKRRAPVREVQGSRRRLAAHR